MRMRGQEDRMKLVLIMDRSKDRQPVSDGPCGALRKITAVFVTMHHPVYIGRIMYLLDDYSLSGLYEVLWGISRKYVNDAEVLKILVEMAVKNPKTSMY